MGKATPLTTAVIVGALVLAGSTGAVARSLITGADVKDGTLTGKDVKNGSLTGTDVKRGSLSDSTLANGPRAYLWKAHYTGDGSTVSSTVTSAKTLPAGTTVRAYRISFSGDTSYCVAHGNPDDTGVNTGWIQVQVSAGGTQLATYHSATDLGSDQHVNASGGLSPAAPYVADGTTHLTVHAECTDVLNNADVQIPMQDYTVTFTFQTTRIDLARPTTFS